MTILDEQLVELRRKFPRAEILGLPDGSSLISIPDLQLPPGSWNKTTTNVFFVAPVGYPIARPDCFWADEDLRLAASAGTPPKGSAIQQPPFPGGPKLWFSWHPSAWTPNRDTLTRYLQVVRDRLERAE